jgi:hypothetical protein
MRPRHSAKDVKGIIQTPWDLFVASLYEKSDQQKEESQSKTVKTGKKKPPFM